MVRIAQASIDEKGNAIGGVAGNQTGNELNIADWYNYSWSEIIRFKDSEKAKKFAKIAETLAKNKCIGYDQAGRITLYNALRKLDWQYEKLSTPCETDCSAFVMACLNCMGIKVNPSAVCHNIWDNVKGTGLFEKLTDSKYLTSADYLITGDIINRPWYHVVICLDNGSKIVQPKPQPQKAPQKAPAKPVSKPKATASVYIVKDGDTLSAIAQRNKTTVAKLTKLNKIKNPNLIHTGDKIKMK